MRRLIASTALVLVGSSIALSVGCSAKHSLMSTSRQNGIRDEDRVRAVVCLYTTRPWLNLDKHGDRDPEGLWYYVYLKDGKQKSRLCEGMFHIEMYKVERDGDEVVRTLVSDWHWSSNDVNKIAKAGLMGEGYVLRLRWAKKDLVGNEVEVITVFEETDGRLCRAETKRLKIPKYRR